MKGFSNPQLSHGWFTWGACIKTVNEWTCEQLAAEFTVDVHMRSLYHICHYCCDALLHQSHLKNLVSSPKSLVDTISMLSLLSPNFKSIMFNLVALVHQHTLGDEHNLRTQDWMYNLRTQDWVCVWKLMLCKLETLSIMCKSWMPAHGYALGDALWYRGYFCVLYRSSPYNANDRSGNKVQLDMLKAVILKSIRVQLTPGSCA